MKLYQFSLNIHNTRYFRISLPKVAWNYEKMYYYLIKDHKMYVYLQRPSRVQTKKRKIHLGGVNQPKISIPKRCIDEELFLPQPRDKVFLTFDEKTREIIIHFDWNYDRVQHLIQMNKNQTLAQLCDNFSQGICSRDPLIIKFVQDSLQLLYSN